MIEISRRFGPVAMGLLFLAVALVLWGETFRDSYHLSRASHATGPAFYPRIVLAGTARAYPNPPWTYWLSPLADLPVAIKLLQSAFRRQHTWRGRTIIRTSRGDSA